MHAILSLLWTVLTLEFYHCQSSGSSPFGGVSFPSFGSNFGSPSSGFGNFGSPMTGFGNFGGNNVAAERPSSAASPSSAPSPSPSPSPSAPAPSPSPSPSAPAPSPSPSPSAPSPSPSAGSTPVTFGTFGGSGGFNFFGGGNSGGGSGGFPSFSGFGFAPASSPGPSPALQGTTGVAGQEAGRKASIGGSSSIRAGVQQGTASDTTTDDRGNQETHTRATPMIFSFGGHAQPNQSGGSGTAPFPQMFGTFRFGGNDLFGSSGNMGNAKAAPAAGGFSPFGGSGGFSPFGGTQGSPAPSGGGNTGLFGGSLFGKHNFGNFGNQNGFGGARDVNPRTSISSGGSVDASVATTTQSPQTVSSDPSTPRNWTWRRNTRK